MLVSSSILPLTLANICGGRLGSHIEETQFKVHKVEVRSYGRQQGIAASFLSKLPCWFENLVHHFHAHSQAWYVQTSRPPSSCERSIYIAKPLTEEVVARFARRLQRFDDAVPLDHWRCSSVRIGKIRMEERLHTLRPKDGRLDLSTSFSYGTRQ